MSDPGVAMNKRQGKESLFISGGREWGQVRQFRIHLVFIHNKLPLWLDKTASALGIKAFF
jgi:hypothetical protein